MRACPERPKNPTKTVRRKIRHGADHINVYCALTGYCVFLRCSRSCQEDWLYDSVLLMSGAATMIDSSHDKLGYVRTGVKARLAVTERILDESVVMKER